MNSPSGTFEKPVGALGEEGTGLADVAKAADVKMFIRSGQPPPFNGFQMITQYINTKLYRRMYPGVPPVPLLPRSLPPAERQPLSSRNRPPRNQLVSWSKQAIKRRFNILDYSIPAVCMQFFNESLISAFTSVRGRKILYTLPFGKLDGSICEPDSREANETSLSTR